MEYQQVSLERLADEAEGVAVATLRRPERMNAVGGRLVHELIDVIESTRYDDAIKVLVITGEGRGFCAGADVGEDEAARAEGRQFVESAYRRHTTAPIGHWGSLFSAIKAYPKPTIAAVNGAAAGAGMSLALVCDIRIASSNARFVSAFVHRAISPDTGSTYHLPRLIGSGRALEMMFTGESVDAQQAAEWGIVNRVVDPEQLMPESLKLAERIARGPSMAIELTKRLVQQSADIDFDGQLEREAWALSISGASEDRARASPASSKNAILNSAGDNRSNRCRPAESANSMSASSRAPHCFAGSTSPAATSARRRSAASARRWRD